MSAKELFRFPDPVNEVSARLVAGGVVVMCVALLATGWMWILIPLTYGFIARVLTGPTLSPLGSFVTRAVTPRLAITPRPTAGPPKRFAQAVGATFSVAAVLAFSVGESSIVAKVFVAMILVAATLESAFGFCLGCKVFAFLMRVGVIPDSVCESCNDLSRRTVAA